MSKSLMFEFEPISIYTCKKFRKELDPCKPLGPSEIPAWALKDSISTIAEQLCFLIKLSWMKVGSLVNAKEPMFARFSNKVILKIHIIIDPYP